MFAWNDGKQMAVRAVALSDLAETRNEKRKEKKV